jgi:hypothetical protein
VRRTPTDHRRGSGAMAATWPALLSGLVGLGICAYQLTLPHALAGVHGYTGYGYDDGVYLTTAVRLVHGALPYRDYAFRTPTGDCVADDTAIIGGSTR